MRAWKFLDPDLAVSQARCLDAVEPRGPLHGVPVGIKDQFDTADMPTTYGTRIYEGYIPPADAELVRKLRAAGAVVMGKTKCTELCAFHPTDTRNPLDPARTPGGSSSGSAAAVADRMVPLAVGTQTVGSTIRPGSYCGVFAYKPTRGSVPRAGALSQSYSLDTVGFFARSSEDLELIAKAATETHPRDASARTALPVDFDLREPGDAGPRIAFVRTPWWSAAEDGTRERLEGLAFMLEARGAVVGEVTLPEGFDGLLEAHTTILEVELARAFSYERQYHSEALSGELWNMLERGCSTDIDSYLEAQRLAASCRWRSGELFAAHDVVLAPSVTAEAPQGLGSTGNPVFCQAWTLLGLPCVSVPGIEGPSGLPLGVQVIGPLYKDGVALGAARWLARQLSDRGGAVHDTYETQEKR